MNRVRIYSLLLIIIITITYYGCDENSAIPPEDFTPFVSLSADKTSGNAPLIVNFTGAFGGKIDTIQMLVPDYFLFPGTGRTIITYALPDTTQSARLHYNESFTYTAVGTYKATMRLQSKYHTYLSDTLVITVN